MREFGWAAADREIFYCLCMINMKVETMLDIFGLSSNYNFMEYKERQKAEKKDPEFTPIIWLEVFILISDNIKSNSSDAT